MKTYNFAEQYGKRENPYTITERHNLLKKCFVCGEMTESITLDGTDYFRYFIHGELAQNVFPYLTPAERDLLITGIHPECEF